MTNSGKPAKTGREKSEFLWGWLFILPTVIGLIKDCHTSESPKTLE